MKEMKMQTEVDPYDLVAEPRRRRVAIPQLMPAPPASKIIHEEKPGADRIVDRYMPLCVLGGGIVVEFVAALVRSHGRLAALGPVALSVIGGAAVMLVGMIIATKFRGIELGNLWEAALKLMAIAVGPAALVTLLAPAAAVIPLGSVGLLLIQFVLYFALLGALFRLDQSDTWYCVCVFFVLRVAVYFALMAAGIQG